MSRKVADETIGEGALVGARFVVTKSVPPRTVVGGTLPNISVPCKSTMKEIRNTMLGTDFQKKRRKTSCYLCQKSCL